MEKGFFALVLHAHLPFVRHPDDDNYLEEKWFYEALTESYIPILNVFKQLARDGVDYRATISLSPPLVSMMADPLLQNRYINHLERLIELADKELKRTAGTEFYQLVDFYTAKLKKIRSFYVEQYNGNILTAFKELYSSGKVDLITCCATHGYLPLMQTREAMAAQVKVAVDFHEQYFGYRPEGIWLPECGYVPGIDEILKVNGIKYFFTDTHGLLHAIPRPKNGVFSPLYTPSGVAAFGRDLETSRQVWDKNHGYPGDYLYREFYRDIGFDLDLDYIGPYVHPAGIRIDTGFKYYRITGKTDQKELYNPTVAYEKAAEHARNFVFNREQQIAYLADVMDRPPIVVSPYDAELFGHWWFEGPDWINNLCRQMAVNSEIKMITPREYLVKLPTNQVANLSMSSWGENGYSKVWLDPSNHWIYRHLHKAEEQMVNLANSHRNATGLIERALNQAARELLLAQSSDWAFIMHTGSAVDYAIKRTNEHISRFIYLSQAVEQKKINEEELLAIEEYDKVFPELDFRVYLPNNNQVKNCLNIDVLDRKRRVLVLTWEFPPKTVGGLARHVYDLTRAMAAFNYEVHVVTCHVPEVPDIEDVGGVKVYRVAPVEADQSDFLYWVSQLNLLMIDKARQIMNSIGEFHIIHAHDWLVAQAGQTIKKEYKTPLIATIHATEYGRNYGIHNEMQKYIHDAEWWLTYESWRVIVCSKYMANEVVQIYQLPDDKVRVIPNGVDPENLKGTSLAAGFREKFAHPYEKIVFFMGRLVPEKGVQVLISAVPKILNVYPDVKFVIAGIGPYEQYLKDEAKNKGIAEKIYFTGFVEDGIRNNLLQFVDVAVFPSLYEPFGIVALETMGSGIPTVISDTGGLSEIIEHGNNGMKAYPGNADSLAENILQILQNEQFAREIAIKGREKVFDFYNWYNIARSTIEVYEEIFAEANLK